MKKSMLFYVVVLLGIILFSGCKSSATDIQEKIYIGTKATQMKFLTDVPPAKTFAATGQKYDLAMEIANKGTFPLRGRLYLSGFDPSIINFPAIVDIPTRQCGFAEIFPKSRSTPNGGVCIEEFQAQLDMRSVADIYDAPLLATLVYPYVTDANIVLCVDPDVYKLKVTQKPCVMTAISVSGGQGAPVAVTRIEPTSIGSGKIMFRIDIFNVGGGEIVDYNKKPIDMRPIDFNTVYYKVGTPSGRGKFASVSLSSSGFNLQVPLGNAFDIYYSGNNFGLSFNPSGNFQYQDGNVKLYNGKATITTVIDYSGVQNAFTTPLQIALAYGYMENLQRSLRIVNVENFAGFEQRGGLNILYDQNGQRIEINSNGGIVYRDNNFDANLGNIIRNI